VIGRFIAELRRQPCCASLEFHPNDLTKLAGIAAAEAKK
jgi:hypothetical protein